TGFAWVRPTLDRYVDWQQTEGLTRVDLPAPELSDAEQSQVAELEAQAAERVGVLEDEESSEADRAIAEAELEALEKAIETITDKAPVLPDELRPSVGAFLVLGPDGAPRLHQTLYADRPDVAGVDEIEAAGDADADAPARVVGLSQRLTDELAIQRRDILAVHVAADPDFALDLAIFLMVDRSPARGTVRYGSTLSARAPQEPVIGFRTPEAAATLARNEADERLERSWIRHETVEARFDAFRMLEPEQRAAWLGNAVAGSLEASVGGIGASLCRFHDHLGTLLDIDTA
ncbi:hypothetical protein LTR94_028835, partial [Friedmanniomyces endolithicus]